MCVAELGAAELGEAGVSGWPLLRAAAAGRHAAAAATVADSGAEDYYPSPTGPARSASSSGSVSEAGSDSGARLALRLPARCRLNCT